MSPLINPLTSKPARLSILLCLTPDDFTRQWGTPGSQWVNVDKKGDDRLSEKFLKVYLLSRIGSVAKAHSQSPFC